VAKLVTQQEQITLKVKQGDQEMTGMIDRFLKKHHQKMHSSDKAATARQNRSGSAG
jgi:hypothetical protein